MSEPVSITIHNASRTMVLEVRLRGRSFSLDGIAPELVAKLDDAAGAFARAVEAPRRRRRSAGRRLAPRAIAARRSRRAGSR